MNVILHKRGRLSIVELFVTRAQLYSAATQILKSAQVK